MTLPAILFALVLALLYGALYHVLRGGSGWRLLLYLFLSVFGFVLGHLVGLWRGWIWIPIGEINLGISSIASLLSLLLGDWLTRINLGTQSKV